MADVKPTASKLSQLQKWILVLALTNKMSEGRGFESAWINNTFDDLTFQEIMIRVYGFSLIAGKFCKHWHDRAGRGVSGWHFDPDAIGRKRYLAARAAISRAIRRLESRGLVKRGCGCSLTPLGVEIAMAVEFHETVNVAVTFTASTTVIEQETVTSATAAYASITVSPSLEVSTGVST